MLKKVSLKALQLAINHALNLDEDMATKIKSLQGKVLKMIIAPLDVSFYIQFADEIVLLDTFDGLVDTTIQSTPIGLIRLSLLPASQARSLFNKDIRISGNIELGQQVKKLFDELDIDWEGHLAHFTGDVVAYQIGSLMRKGLAFKKQIDTSMRLNMTEYLQEELRILPSEMELEDFFNDVDTLVLDTERLEAHINLLMTRHENS
ncbi:MAG: SCP2 sterol-binding domain-containing protein [Legionella sp.]|nr:SCP2 sterol-binding domain-containing protein [Legionella sp.]